jgi:protein phosphatase
MNAQPVFRYDSWAVSHRGCVRELNEDRYLIEPESRGGLWVVADGMGGHDAGEVASGAIVDHLATMGIPSSGVDQQARFVDRLSRANQELQDYSRRRGGVTVGSTVAALLVFEDEYRCMWMGDSRVYRIRRGQLQQISRDHSEVRELVDRGLLTPEEARRSPRRNVITRAVGVHASINVETENGIIEPGDCFVLCSDGLTAHCSDAEILDAVRGRKPQDACQLLLDTVLARGGTDNVTIIIVQCRSTEKTIPVADVGLTAAQ